MPKKLYLRLWDRQGKEGPYIDLPPGDYPKLSGDSQGRFQDRAAFAEVVASDDPMPINVPSAFAAMDSTAPVFDDDDAADALNPANSDRLAITYFDNDNFRDSSKLPNLTFKSPVTPLPSDYQDDIAAVKWRVIPAASVPAALGRIATIRATRDSQRRASESEARKAKAQAQRIASESQPIPPVFFSVGGPDNTVITVRDPKPDDFPADFKDVSGGKRPAALGLPAPLVTFDESIGDYRPAKEEYDSVYAAARRGDNGAQMALADIGVQPPQSPGILNRLGL